MAGKVEVPTTEALGSVAAFRKRAEELGVRYRDALRERERGAAEIERAELASKSEATKQRVLPPLAAAQRRRTQEFVNAREALRQMGFDDAEMRQRFSPYDFEPSFGPEDTNRK